MGHLKLGDKDKDPFKALVFPAILIFSFVFLINSSVSDTMAAATLKGKVTSQQGEPLSFASVYLQGTTEGTTTNQEGRYKLKLPVGEHNVVFQYMGYEQKRKTVSLEKNEEQTLDVTLSKRAYETEAVTVTGKDPAYRIIKNAIKQ